MKHSQVKVAACRPLTADEQGAVLLAATRPRQVAAWLLMSAAGLRSASALALTVGDARAAVRDGVLRLARRDVKRARAATALPLRLEARVALALWLCARTDEPADAPLLGVSRVTLWSDFRSMFQAAGLAGLDVPGMLGTHVARKTFAARVFVAARERAAAEGSAVSPLEVARRALGHADLSTTIAYLPVAGEDVTAAILA